MLGRCALVVVVGCLGACTHSVQVTSNVPEAEVRVDGVPVGQVKDGATFEEKWGFGRIYDIEVKAPRRAVARRQVKPNVVDAATGVPALAVAVGGCGLSSCVVPLVALVTLTSVPDPGGQAIGYGSSAAILGCTALSTSVVAFGSQRLPDEIYVELDPEVGLGDQGLPPPPAP